MTEQTVATETQQQPEQAASTATAQEQATGVEARFTQADVDRMIKERLERERRKAEDSTAKAKADAEAEAAKKNGEYGKLAEQYKAELEKAQADLKARDLLDRKRAIAEKVSLPAALASRLIGETDEEIEADAVALLATIPKQPPAHSGAVLNPGANGSTGETDEQRRLRLNLR
jgi:uncharacterized protein YdaU (DUF1376 family)